MDVSETSPQGDVREEPDQMLEPPHLVPLKVEEQQLYSDLLPRSLRLSPATLQGRKLISAACIHDLVLSVTTQSS